MPEPSDACRANRLLAALPPAEFDRFARHLDVADLPRGHVIAATGDSVHRVWFPLDAVVSVTLTLRDGGTAEGAAIGREGMTGCVTALGSRRSLGNQVVQVGGRLAGIDAAQFRAAFEERPAVRDLALRYNEALFGHVLQAVACNALHPAEARMAEWLLMLQDRTGGASTLRLTHEFLAGMLGVHRPTVSAVAGALQAAGLIRSRRGTVEVLDRPGLEAAACECYGIVRDLYERLLPRAADPADRGLGAAGP